MLLSALTNTRWWLAEAAEEFETGIWRGELQIPELNTRWHCLILHWGLLVLLVTRCWRLRGPRRKVMALILQKHAGRLYEAQLLQPLCGQVGVQSAPFRGAFAALDARLGSVAPLEAAAFWQAIDEVLSAEGLLTSSVAASSNLPMGGRFLMASREISSKPSVTAEVLKAANARARNAAGKSSFRTGPMWVGAAHPADAWYVAPPAAHVHALLRDLFCFINDRKWPLTLRACVAMQQLLDIHPFADGNGRTARALLLGMLVQRWGLQQGFVSALAGFWAERGLRRHAATYQIRASGDWSAFLQMSLALGWGCRLAPTATKECNT